jgi:hypothetical protein
MAEVVSDDEQLLGNPSDWMTATQSRLAGDALDKPPAHHGDIR